MPRKRIIAVVTGSRADYGLLEPVMCAIDAHTKLSLRVIATGLHLVQRTDSDIIFPVAAQVAMQKRSTTGFGTDVEAVARGVAGFGRIFAKMKPDFVLVLGDRIEVFAAATAANLGGHHLAHIHGGDRAEGVADEAIRHAVTKLAHLHLPATATSRRRIIRMGENPDYVFNVGSPSIDGLANITPANNGPQIILVQHPVGASNAQERQWAQQTLAVVRSLKMSIFIGSPNHDPGSEGTRRGLGLKVGQGRLPRREFAGALAGAGIIVGNSSAGLIEAASLRIACVNIGPRQNGREKCANVIDCNYGQTAVRRALLCARKLDLRRMRHPYGNGQASCKMANLLATITPPWRKQNMY